MAFNYKKSRQSLGAVQGQTVILKDGVKLVTAQGGCETQKGRKEARKKDRLNGRAGTSQLAKGSREYDAHCKDTGELSSSYGETIRCEALYKAHPHEEKLYQKARNVMTDSRHVAVDNFDRQGEVAFIGQQVARKTISGEAVSDPVILREEASRRIAMAYNRKLEAESAARAAMLSRLDEIFKSAREFALEAGLSAKEASVHARCVRASIKAVEYDNRPCALSSDRGYKGKPLYNGYKLGAVQQGVGVIIERGKIDRR